MLIYCGALVCAPIIYYICNVHYRGWHAVCMELLRGARNISGKVNGHNRAFLICHTPLIMLSASHVLYIM